MERTDAGIDYGNGLVNIDQATGIRYGVISQHKVLQAWADSSEADYGQPVEPVECPECGEVSYPDKDCQWGESLVCECEEEIELELPDDAEPLAYTLDDGEYQAQCGDDGDIFILKSPYFTLCAFCSPCAPGAGYLMSPRKEGIKAYCFGHDWFDDQQAPYPVFRVDTGEEVKP